MTTPRYDPHTQHVVPAESHGVSEAQRAQVMQRLADAFAADRISMDELDARLSRLYQVQTLAQLEQLLEDPSSPGVSLTSPLSAARPAQEFALPERGVGIAIMGGFDRGEGWVLPRRFKAIAIMGGVKLDLRDARIAPGVSEIEVVTVWGGVEILVPDGVRVEVVGMAVMGGFDAKSSVTSLDDPNAPVIRVSGFALMAGVEIKRKDRERKNERRYVEALERAERLHGARDRRGS